MQQSETFNDKIIHRSCPTKGSYSAFSVHATNFLNDLILCTCMNSKRIVRNVRKMLESKPSKLELENLLTALPRGSRPKRNYDEESD